MSLLGHREYREREVEERREGELPLTSDSRTRLPVSGAGGAGRCPTRSERPLGSRARLRHTSPSHPLERCPLLFVVFGCWKEQVGWLLWHLDLDSWLLHLWLEVLRNERERHSGHGKR